MAINKKELEQEKKYLQKVKKVLKESISNSEGSVESRKDSLNELKKFMWDHLSDYTDEERAIALYEMDRDVDLTNQSIDTIMRYKKSLQSPYFAKLVFKGDDVSEKLPIYIGITTVQKDGVNFLVFDWRAPIASMFYNYEVGKASYDAPVGTIKGEILDKMQFKIAKGKMERCFKSDINIDDDYLQEILASASSSKMKNIVSTIQREQNKVIRNNDDKCIIVQGIAGSGKTSVALHRIAYLLYRNKDLSSNNILIFSPNDVFSDYISDVLPELGERNVLKTTLSEFATAFLKPYKNIENYSEFLERSYSQEQDNETIKYKMSDCFKEDIDEFMEFYEDSIKVKNNLSYNNVIVSKNDIEDMIKDRYRKIPMNERLYIISENICGQFRIPRKRIKAVKKKILENSNIELDYSKLYQKFLNSDLYKGNDSSFTTKKINFEDITGLAYFNFSINGYPSYGHIRQIAIDEAQDYSKFQIEMLSKIFKNASFTILGDVNQAINPYYHYDSLDELKEIFSNGKYLELTKSYRSSEEIVEYSNKILGLNNLCSVRKSNDIPVSLKNANDENLTSSIQDDLEEMKKNGMNKIAIITKNVKDAKIIYNNMKNFSKRNPKIQLVSSSDSVIEKPTVIIPSYLSKGLEFDGVIAYNNPENSYNADEKKLYYVVCTRAQHQLNVYNEPLKILKKSK
ncbi:MAG: AAA family ATPase [Bacilli bacterium]|nr:AAA family ATPase [Bacilli bacterium]